MAWHAGGNNTGSIGIELMGITDFFRKNNDFECRAEYNQVAKKLQDEETNLTNLKDIKKSLANIKSSTATSSIDARIENAENKITVLKGKKEKYEKLKWNKKKRSEADIKKYKNWLKAKDKNGISSVYKYTEEQYKSLGKLLEIIGKRYGYKKVCSHHHLDPKRKFDPGKYFDWSKLKKYLLEGSFEKGHEKEGGGDTKQLMENAPGGCWKTKS